MASDGVLISTVADYPAKLKELLSKPAPHYVVYSADLDESSKLPWCPDCVRTLPAIKEGVAQRGGSLLEVRVGPRTAWKTPDHPFRLDPELKLGGIPTLIHFQPDGKQGARVGPELEACNTPDEAAALTAKFIGQTAP